LAQAIHEGCCSPGARERVREGGCERGSEGLCGRQRGKERGRERGEERDVERVRAHDFAVEPIEFAARGKFVGVDSTHFGAAANPFEAHDEQSL
jgi:hypothetical protein